MNGLVSAIKLLISKNIDLNIAKKVVNWEFNLSTKVSQFDSGRDSIIEALATCDFLHFFDIKFDECSRNVTVNISSETHGHLSSLYAEGGSEYIASEFSNELLRIMTLQLKELSAKFTLKVRLEDLNTQTAFDLFKDEYIHVISPKIFTKLISLGVLDSMSPGGVALLNSTTKKNFFVDLCAPVDHILSVDPSNMTLMLSPVSCYMVNGNDDSGPKYQLVFGLHVDNQYKNGYSSWTTSFSS